MNQAVLFQAAAQHRYGAEYILKDIEELTHYIDHAVSGGDSIEQKMQAERDAADRKPEI